jgi:hypothetical protein
MKKYLLIIILLLSITLVSAYNPWAYKTPATSLINKELVDIDNCYNLTVTYELTNGNTTPVSFVGCTDKGSNTWFCDCKTTIGTYTLTMSTDGAVIKKDRKYKMTIDYYVYDLNKESNGFTVIDAGTDASVSGKNLEDLGRVVEYIDVPIYINKTIYVDKIIEKPVYVDVPRDVYIENTTRIDILRNNLTIQLNSTQIELRQARSARNWWMIIAIIFILIATIIGYMVWEQINKGE